MADYNTLNTPTRSSSRPASTRSTRSNGSREASSRTSEQTPLLAREDGYHDSSDEVSHERPQSRRSSIYSSIAPKIGILKRRWPSFVALLLLVIFTISIMLLGFFVPDTLEEYAMQAKQFELTSVSLPEFTANGAKARVQGVFWMDPSQVKKKTVRDLGVFGTWIAGAVKSGDSTVKVRLPDYGNVLLGTAQIPPVKVSIRANQKTNIDFLADLEPGDIDGIRKVADDYLNSRLQELKVTGEADVKIRFGIISLPTQTIAQTLVFAGNDIPAIPSFNITKLLFHEVELPNKQKGMVADVSVWVKNDYPVDFTVPSLGFDILVDNCLPDQPRIMVADAQTPEVPIHPKEDLNVNVSGLVQHLPDELTNQCPGSGKSPLDSFLGEYMKGEDITIYVRGSDKPSPNTPKWLTELISSVTVPVPFKGHTFDNLIRNFTLADVHFSLPDPFAEPDSPEANPQISALIKAYINIPGEMNFPIDVNRVRANANVYYKGKKMGRLNLHKWQQASSRRIPPKGSDGPALLVESAIEKAPLEITDQNVFSDVVQKMLFGGNGVQLAIKADVDVEMETALGVMTVREIPAEGVVPVQPISSGGKHGGLTDGFSPKVTDLEIIDTSEAGLVIQASVDFTNPTNYSATVPFVDISIEKNGTTIGHAQVANATIVPGKNGNVVAKAMWEPSLTGGKVGAKVGRELLSQYISGYNTTLTFRTNRDTIPLNPLIGEALSKFNVTLKAPKLSPPSDGDDEPEDPEDPEDPIDDPDQGPKFIKTATMHLLSSTAVFTLLSPFKHTTLYITSINATAIYKPDDPDEPESEVGTINYEGSFAVRPGESESPRLPVEWDLGSVGYEAVRKALGGTLKLRAEADVGVKIGLYEVNVWFKGKGIGAGVRL